MRILLTGGSGLLGSELRRIDRDIDAPSSVELDICDAASIERYLAANKPDVIIHAAAETDNRAIERDAAAALDVNIKGTVNLVLACLNTRIRFVYLSTDYVYKGDCGDYRETDGVQPANLYAWTKLGGEAAVRAVPNHLIIRTSFGAATFDYPGAFRDKWSSKEYVDLIAGDVLQAALSPLSGVLHLGSDRRSLYDYAKSRNPDVAAIEMDEAAHMTPVDTSLNRDVWSQYLAGEGVVRGVSECRICESRDLSMYLDLGMLPMANNLAESAAAARRMQRFPMQVMYCKDCSLSQLSVVVDPRELFAHYTYRSSINKGYIRHCREMARSVGKQLQLESADLVVDIAGNDGALLVEFKDEIGVRVVNVDPAKNIATIAESRGIPTINEFWSAKVAEALFAEYGKPKLITATNVFAHVDDVRGFMAAAKSCLDERGALVLEFPYAVDFIEKREFDTIYFEHLSYVLIEPVRRLAASTGMAIFDVQKQAIHGGTVRVFIGHDSAHDIQSSVGEFLENEKNQGFHDVEIYKKWSDEVGRHIDDLTTQLRNLKSEGASIAAFAASAKGNTLLNTCGLDRHVIDYIVDDTPEKIGQFSPGTGIPVVDRSALAESAPDYLLLLAWNFAHDILGSTTDFRDSGGRYIMPIPEFRILRGCDDE